MERLVNNPIPAFKRDCQLVEAGLSSLKFKSGQTITATYTGLQNSKYNGGISMVTYEGNEFKP